MKRRENRRRWIQCRETGKLIPEEEYYQEERVKSANVHQDTIDPLWHPVADKICASKSEFRRLTKQHGYEEVGNETTRGQDARARAERAAATDRALEATIERCYSDLSVASGKAFEG